MLLLSTLVACLHLGLVPPDSVGGAGSDAVFGDIEISAPVAEPGVDEALRTALSQALAARGGLGGGPVLAVTITNAALDPTLRGDPAGQGGGLWYRATLVARVDTPSRSRAFVVTDWVLETGQVPDRARVYSALADRLGVQIAAWAVSGGEAPPPPDVDP